MEFLLIAFYSLMLTLLFIYGLNIFYLTFRARRNRSTTPKMPELSHCPTVTIQLPIYNERYVAKRVIIAACRLDWPAEALQIQVLDDSTDDTTAIVQSVVGYFQKLGVNIQHLHRRNRKGFKAGALAAGLREAEGEFIAIFDADFVPTPDFLQRTIPHFADKDVAFVQTRWGHLNTHDNLLTRLQSIAIDAHFAVEQYARHQAGYFINFNGTGGVWHRTAIDMAGGWQADTLTEDLDLSYRIQLLGKRGVYLRDVVAPGEIPITLNAFRRQQHRWARGSIECAKKLLPQLFSTKLPAAIKFQGLMHLTGYGIQLLMSLVVICYLPLLLFAMPRPELKPLYALTILFTLTFFAPTFYLITGQQELGRPWRFRAKEIVLLSFLGVGMMYHNAAAVLSALFAPQPAIFERTPKYGNLNSMENLNLKNDYKLKLSPIVLFEVLMVLYNALTIIIAFQQGNWSIAFYTVFFMAGLLFILGLNLYQELCSLWLSYGSAQQQSRTTQTPLLPEPDQNSS